MSFCLLISILITNIYLITSDYIYNVPYEQYYLPSNISRSYTVNGCKINEWIGMCSVGLYGYQFVTTINCPNNNMYQMKGINNLGELNMINIIGKEITFSVNNSQSISTDKLSSIGDYVWFSPGLILDINITGSVYLYGGNTSLTSIDNTHGIKSATHTYNTIPYRVYKILNGLLGHDPHINNGNSYAFDVMFSTKTNIDPPYIFIINCDNNTFVENHFHPWNALYLPLSKGNLYFISEDYNNTLGEAIIGYPRWVSATLRYNEKFILEKYKNSNIEKLINALGINQSKCENPLLFAVTNFDVNSTIGAPNFDDNVTDTMEITPTRLVSIVVAH